MDISVAIGVRHPIMRCGVAYVLNAHKMFQIVAQASELKTLGESIKKERPSIALVDSTLLQAEGRTAFLKLKRANPSTRLLMLSLYERPQPCCDEAAAVPVLDSLTPSALTASIEKAMAAPQSERATNCDCKVSEPGLTSRESEVLYLVAQGYNSAEIAQMLSISQRTVELHRYRVCRKLRVRSPLDLAKYILRRGLAPAK